MSHRVARLVLLAMEERGLSTIELAERAGVHRSDLGRWLAGTRDIRLSKAMRVMDVVGLVVVKEDRCDGNRSPRGSGRM